MSSPTAAPTVGTAAQVIDHVASGTVQVMDKIPQTLKDVLDVLSQKLGATGKALFSILVKQQLVYGAQDILTVILLGTILLVWWMKIYKVLMSKIHDDEGRVLVTVLAAMATVGLFIAICVNVVESVGYFINPQYYAIQDLLKMAHGS